VLPDMVVEFCGVFGTASIQELVDHCLVLLLLVLVERNHTVILSIFFGEICMHVFEG